MDYLVGVLRIRITVWTAFHFDAERRPLFIFLNKKTNRTTLLAGIMFTSGRVLVHKFGNPAPALPTFFCYKIGYKKLGRKKFDFIRFLKATTKKRAGSVIQWYGSADPNPETSRTQNTYAKIVRHTVGTGINSIVQCFEPEPPKK